MDYCFPRDETGQRLTILVAEERYSRMKKAVVPSKGSAGMYAARMVLELISECGDKDRDVIMKTDQEPAMKFLVDYVCMARTGAWTIQELVPKNSKGSNGVVERAVQSVEQFVRTLKSALDERMAVKIDTFHTVLTWLCEYAGLLLNRLEVSSDGKTNARWGYGLFFGVKSTSEELIVVNQETKSGVFLSGTGGCQTICSGLQPLCGTKGTVTKRPMVTCQSLTSRRGRVEISLRRRRWTSCLEKRRGACTGSLKARIHRQVLQLFRDFGRSQHSAAFATVPGCRSGSDGTEKVTETRQLDGRRSVCVWRRLRTRQSGQIDRALRRLQVGVYSWSSRRRW